jgi:hypothetical protein
MEYIQNYPSKWREHVNRMTTGRITKPILHYQLRGQRLIGCPVKGWGGEGEEEEEEEEEMMMMMIYILVISYIIHRPLPCNAP